MRGCWNIVETSEFDLSEKVEFKEEVEIRDVVVRGIIESTELSEGDRSVCASVCTLFGFKSSTWAILSSSS